MRGCDPDIQAELDKDYEKFKSMVPTDCEMSTTPGVDYVRGSGWDSGSSDESGERLGSASTRVGSSGFELEPWAWFLLALAVCCFCSCLGGCILAMLNRRRRYMLPPTMGPPMYPMHGGMHGPMPGSFFGGPPPTQPMFMV
jgi:hypothetical protein